MGSAVARRGYLASVRRLVTPLAVLLVVVLGGSIVAGCGAVGGTPDIDDVRDCLKRAKLDVKGPQGADAARVTDGVSGTSGLGEGFVDADQPLTIVVAANVTKDEYVDEFSKQSNAFRDKLSPEERAEFQVRSGNDGKYVWVVAGDETSKTFRAAQECVKP